VELSWSGRFAKGGSWLTPEELEEAGRLLKAARSDLRAAKALAADAEQENDVIGFHAQQALEKSLKAVLAASGTEIPYTHDLSFLLDVTAEQGLAVPKTVSQADWLTPWAVAVRYGTADTQLDRALAVAVATEAVQWAAGIVEVGPAQPGL
jgi:HEPN domain-containing protein